MDLYPVYAMMLFLQIVMCETKYVCKKTNDPDVQANLTCNSNHMIHVISETYGNGTLQHGCLNKTNTCTAVLKNDSQVLDVNCNGKQNCSVETAPDSAARCSPVQGREIQYECVKDSLNVCRTREELTNGSVYLHSPNFPDSSRVNDSCTCRITGTLMSIQLIQHRDRKKDLNISTDGDNLPQGVTPVNRIIAKRANDTTLNYQGLEDGLFWIKVTGLGMIVVKCLNESRNITSMATTTPATTKESSSTGVGLVNVTCSDDETNDMQSTTMDTTTTGTTKESSGAGTGMVTSPNPTYEMSTVTSDTGTIGNTDLSSDTESTTANEHNSITTSYTTGTTEESADKVLSAGALSIIELASIAAAGGLVVLVLTIVGVIRCKQTRKIPMAHDDTDTVELGEITSNPAQRRKNGQFADHNYFQLDPAFVSRDTRNVYSVAEDNSKKQLSWLPQNTNNILRTEINQAIAQLHNAGTDNQDEQKCVMIKNDIYVGGPVSKEANKVDSFLSRAFKLSDVDTISETMNQSDESPMNEQSTFSEEVLGDEEERMMINHLYHSYQSTSVVDGTITQQSSNHRHYSHGEGGSDGDQRDDMVVNYLYHSNQTTPRDQHDVRDIPLLSAQTAQPDDRDGQDGDTDIMVINSLYHSYPLAAECQIQHKEQDSHCRAEDNDDYPNMAENNPYYSEIESRKDDDTKRGWVSDGYYEEIVDDELFLSADSEGNDTKPRPAAYEEIVVIPSA